MNKRRIYTVIAIAFVLGLATRCKLPPSYTPRIENKVVNASFADTLSNDSTKNTGTMDYSKFFTDANLVALIDTAAKNNQDLNIFQQEIMAALAEVGGRKGAYLPYLDIEAGGGADKAGRYTRNGALEANIPVAPGKNFSDPYTNMMLSANINWQVDIWKKLRNSRKAANIRYLASIQGRRFMQTMMVAEIAEKYYELMALDNKLIVLQQNIQIQSNALQVVRQQKIAGMVTELAVKKFEAEVLKNQSHQYSIKQQIIEAENRINFLVGRMPQPVTRSSAGFIDLTPGYIEAGIPSQLLANRTDIKEAELRLEANKLDVRIARANFYPSLNLSAGIGYQAINAKYFLRSPQSLIYNIAGDLIAPLVNRYAIKAEYYSANSRQIQAIYTYEKTILNAYIEVINRLAKYDNLNKGYALKQQQVQALVQSIGIAGNLFNTARADYMEVLMTQRDAVESRMELIEMKQDQMSNWVDVYQALGGGWH